MEYTYRNDTVDAWHRAGVAKLEEQRLRVTEYINLYEGDPVGTDLEGESRTLFRQLLKESRTNWCELVVNSVAERLAVQWFNFGDDATNELAWAIWQASSMDADSEMSQTDALVCGLTPISVWPDESNPTGVRIWPEHPLEVTTFYAPGTRRNPVAAFKSFGGSLIEGTAIADRTDVLVLPDYILTWTKDGLTVQDNQYGLVPYVDITPAPRTLGTPRSELHSAATIQKRINTTIYNRMVSGDFGAFRQVTATGIKLERRPVKDLDGNVVGEQVIAPYNVGADRLLVSENPDSSFGAIPEATMSGYLSAVEADVQHLAAITKTPPHYLLGQMVNISADALKAAETGLVSKVRRRAAHIGEAWEDVMRLALGFLGNPETVNYQAEVVWRDFETRSEGELVDALVKMNTLGVPREELWTRWGASPPQIKRWSALLDAQQAAQAAAEPTPAEVPTAAA